MAELSRYVCPNCNGVLQFSPGNHEVTCSFCGGTFSVEDLKAPDIGDEEEVELQSTEHVAGVEDFLKRAPWGNAEGNIVSHTCSTCGAEIVCDQATVSTNCPYCGNVMVASSTLAGHQPQMILPFKVDRSRAEEVMGKHVRGKWYLPKAFEAELQHVQGIYVPYYLYSTTAHGWAWYDGETDTTVGTGKNKRTITTHSRVYREADATFVRVPVDGSSKMPDGHMDAIEPFDYDEFEPFNVGYLAGYLAEIPDETPDDCWGRAQDRCENTFDEKLRSDAKRHVDRVTREEYETNVELSEVETTMIPVWLMHCTWEDENMLFAVNGQTAKIVGDMPYDKGKRALTIALSLIVAAAAAIYFLIMRYDGDDRTGRIIIAVIISVFVPAIIDGIFMGQVRTANVKHEADDAVDRGRFEVTSRQG